MTGAYRPKRYSSHMFKRTGSKKWLKSIITLLPKPACGMDTIIQILLPSSQPRLLLAGWVSETSLPLRPTVKSTHWQSNSFTFQTCTKTRTVITSTVSQWENEARCLLSLHWAGDPVRTSQMPNKSSKLYSSHVKPCADQGWSQDKRDLFVRRHTLELMFVLH